MEVRTICERLDTIDCNLRSACREPEDQCLVCLGNKDNGDSFFINKEVYTAVKYFMENQVSLGDKP